MNNFRNLRRSTLTVVNEIVLYCRFAEGKFQVLFSTYEDTARFTSMMIETISLCILKEHMQLKYVQVLF